MGKTVYKTPLKDLEKVFNKAVERNATKSFMKNVGKVAKKLKNQFSASSTKTKSKKSKKSAVRVGSATGKYAGKFKNAVSVRSRFDKYLDKGVVLKTEYGGVFADLRNVTYIGHSTMPALTVLKVAWGALMKALFAKAQMYIKNWDTPVLDSPQSKNMRVRIYYKTLDSQAVAFEELLIVAQGSSLATIVDDIISKFGVEGTKIHPQQQFLSIRLFNEIELVPTFVQCAYTSLVEAYIEFYSESELKLQNRTVNTTANDQADDVDNVPIHGRSFDFRSNGTVFRDYNLPAGTDAAALTSDVNYGFYPFGGILPSATGTTMYDDIPTPSQFAGVYGSMNNHLDPGQIKNSILRDSASITLNGLYSVICNTGDRSLTSGIQVTKRTWIGKSRFFCWEKQVNTVAATSENSFKLAFEANVELGGICHMPNRMQTAPKLIKAQA